MRRLNLVGFAGSLALISGSCAGGGDIGSSTGGLADSCATKTYTQSEAGALEQKLNRVFANTDEDRQSGSITVHVYAHVLQSKAASATLTAADVHGQIDKLNSAFSGGMKGPYPVTGHNTAFRFSLDDKDIDFTKNDAWAHMAPQTKEERDAKTALHKGGPRDLNIYIADVGDGVLGWSTFPWEYTADPVMDGVVVNEKAVPAAARQGVTDSGGLEGHTGGDIAIHMAGHWLGLYHTWQGECDGVSDDGYKFGDGVLDTPRQAGPTLGCPAPDAQPDTCDFPTSHKKDMVYNSMSGSDGDCQDGFTHGQSKRMNWAWKFRQAEPDACGNGQVDPQETCDINIPAGTNGACPTDCDDKDACTNDSLQNAGTCTAVCAHTEVGPMNGDGCCPAGETHATDSDCPVDCGNGHVDSGETCDTGIHSGPGTCPTEADCADSDSCTTDSVEGDGTCTATCKHSKITVPHTGDNCCPSGANANNDGDCDPVCGNGAQESGEECDDGNTKDGDGCDHTCKKEHVPACGDGTKDPGEECDDGNTKDGDGCSHDCKVEHFCGDGHVDAGEECDDGNDENDDACSNNCKAPTGMRIDTLSLVDPHVYANSSFGCIDGTSIANGQLKTQITTDGNSDGFIDMSGVIAFFPLTQTDGASQSTALNFAQCTMPVSSTVCTASDNNFSVNATFHKSGTCLGPVPGTVTSGTPNSPAGPCVVSDPKTIQISLQGANITLYDAQFSATTDATPATKLTTGLLRGFVTEADAETTVVPLPDIAGGPQTLASLLLGGKDNCQDPSPSVGDKDTNNGKSGWWFYLNFTAAKRPYTP